MTDRNNRAVAERIRAHLDPDAVSRLKAWTELAKDPGDGRVLTASEAIDLANLGMCIHGGPPGSDAVVMAFLEDLAERLPDRESYDYDLWETVVHSAFSREQEAEAVIAMFQEAVAA